MDVHCKRVSNESGKEGYIQSRQWNPDELKEPQVVACPKKMEVLGRGVAEALIVVMTLWPYLEPFSAARHLIAGHQNLINDFLF